MNFKDIFTQVLVLFIIILVGYYTRKKDLIDKDFTSKLSRLVLYIFLPSLILNSMQINFTKDMINKIIILLLISIFMYIISFIIAYIVKLTFKDEEYIGIYQYAIMFSNVGFMGYPVIEAILGKDALFYAAIFNLPFNLLVITIGKFLLSKEDSIKFSIKNFINPIIISIFIGFILFIFNLRLPNYIYNSLKLLGGVTTPLSMLVIGSLLYESSIKNLFINKKMYIVSFIRLILLPILIYLLLVNIIDDRLVLSIAVIISSMPAAANTAIMADEYNSNASLASQIVFITTLFSIVSIPVISIFLLI